MLKTISSKNSLIPWARNQNSSNIDITVLDGDEMFLKPMYMALFTEVADSLKKSPDVFVRLWSDLCDKHCGLVSKSLKKALKAKKLEAEPGDIDRVAAKFRGNVGEILVEALFANGVVNLGMPGTYEPVDPTNERYIDATIERDGLPIGIQIKNYSVHGNVGREILTKAESMDTHWIRVEKKIPQDKILEFLESPSQYVIATCKPTSDLLLDEVKNAVVYLGPEWLDNLKIQGDRKTGEASRHKIFQNIVEELDKLQ